ncbi:hypothetical protein BGZ59_001566 [Podila verticillata]|nr:hypothetical protein BGZ59_001566 [Podila verticillata]KFH71875.1 hypothetical protein MVEG_02169 [Podila verticillata NRRL 6337]
MTNQTKLGFNHKKPGTTTRPLQQKYANKALRSVHAASGDDTTDPSLPEEHLLDKIGNLSQTMEEKLAEYQRKKKAASTIDTKAAPSLNLNRSLRSSTKASKEIGKESGGIAKPAAKPIARTTRTRLSTTTSISLVQTDISHIFQQTKTTAETETIEAKSTEVVVEETTVEEDVVEPQRSSTPLTQLEEEETKDENQDQAQAQSSLEETNDEPVTKVKEAQSEENGLKTSAQTTEDQKPTLEDTVYKSGVDDDIHPLARTVVMAKPLSPRKPTKHAEEQDTYTSKSHVAKPAHAYSRAQEKLKDTVLPMPGHMKTLTAIFKGLEEMIVFTKSQGQLCFYHRLKKPVELQSSRNFEIKHLAQLRTVWPDGYKFTQSPCLFEGQRVQSVLMEQLAPKEEPTGYFVPRAERRNKAFLEHMQAHIQHFHKKFLESSDPPRTDTYPHSWHPDFDLESVPPIEEGDVPLLKPVIVDSSKLDLSGLSSRRALEIGHKSKVAASTKESLPSLPSPASSTVSSPSGEGSSVKPLTALEQLKEKIRLQQLARKESTVGLATPEEKQQRLVASRLPAVFDLIRFKRIEVISIKALTEQVVKSSRMPISEQEGKQSLEMLAERLPEWCSVYQLSDGMYFKVLKKADGEAHDIRALRTRLVSGVVAK